MQFDKHQWGFRHGTGTEHAPAFLARQRQKGHRVVVVLNLKAAYDRAPRQAIADIGEERLHPTLAGMVQTLLSPGRIAARNEPLTGKTVTAGVPQGDPISPSLFNLLKDTLLTRARSAVNYDDRNMSCFADDVMIMATSLSHDQLLLDLCKTWALEFKMRWSVQKCAHLCQEDKPPPVPKLALGGDKLPVSRLVRYLGVDLDWNGVHTSSVDRIIPKALNCLHILRSTPSYTAYRSQTDVKSYAHSYFRASITPSRSHRARHNLSQSRLALTEPSVLGPLQSLLPRVYRPGMSTDSPPLHTSTPQRSGSPAHAVNLT